MKKVYETPQCELIDVETEEIICVSTPIGDEADEPALAPPLDEDFFLTL